MNTISNDKLNQRNRLDSTMLPAQPVQTYSAHGESIYSPPTNFSIDTMQPSNQHIQSSPTNLNGSLCSGKNSMSDTYMSYNQNGHEQIHEANNAPIPVQQFDQVYTSGRIITNSNPIDKTNDGLVMRNSIQYTNGHQSTKYSTLSNKPSPQIQSFQQSKQATSGHKSSQSSLESSNSCSMMPLNVKTMLVNGVSNKEVMCNWLKSIKCEEYTKNFIDNGYDIPLLARMTPQDLTAIGCKSLEVRKKLLFEIKKLNLDDGIPECRPSNLESWLEILKLSEYHNRLCDEGYDTIDKVCELTWEDLEDIGINKLGHQKRLLLGIERVLKFDKQQEERQNDFAIYDVHPNHRICLNPSSSDNRLSTISRSKVRSGFFQTKSGPNLDHKGLPVATVMPALKYVNNSLASYDISRQVLAITDIPKGAMSNSNSQSNNRHSVYEQSNQMQFICPVNKSSENSITPLDDQTTTLKRNPPPLPPVRTNSLKMPSQESNGQFNNNNNLIYGNNYGVAQSTGLNYVPMTIGSTSFLRTPKLGTLTATTNKMLTLGGHIESVNGQPTMIRSIMPIREAPLPPIPSQHLSSATIRDRIDEEPMMTQSYPDPSNNSGGNNIGDTSAQLINQSLIGHQLACADEFPPPPPPPPPS